MCWGVSRSGPLGVKVAGSVGITTKFPSGRATRQLPAKDGNGGNPRDFHSFAERGGTLGDSRTGGDDIVDEKDAGTSLRRNGQLLSRYKYAGQVRESRAAVELCLSGGLFDPLQERLETEIGPRRGTSDEFEGKFAGLIESPFAESPGVQGHGHDPPDSAAEPLIPPDFVEQDSEKPPEVTLFSVLKMMHQALARSAPAVGADGEVYREFAVAAVRAAERRGAF